MYRLDAAVGVVGMLFGALQPKFAAATDLVTPLPDWAQVGVCGLFGVVLLVVLVRTIPDMNARHAEGIKAIGETCERGMKAMADEVREMRNDIQENTQAQFKLLSEVVNRHD